MQLGDLVRGRFTVPENPIVLGMESKPVQTGNPLMYELTKGCMAGSPCRAGIQGLGEFEVPLIGVKAPGQQWMYLLALGAVAGIWFMSRGKK
jgi:hypothetical protein